MEPILVLVVVEPVPESRGIEDEKVSSQKMLKSSLSLAIFVLLGALVVASPGFAPKVQADEVAALAKADRLEVGTVVSKCSTQIWPEFANSCLRHAGSGAKIEEARLVTARR